MHERLDPALRFLLDGPEAREYSASLSVGL